MSRFIISAIKTLWHCSMFMNCTFVGIMTQMNIAAIFAVRDQIGPAELPADDPLFYILLWKRERQFAAQGFACIHPAFAIDSCFLVKVYYVVPRVLIWDRSRFQWTFTSLSATCLLRYSIFCCKKPFFDEKFDKGIKKGSWFQSFWWV